MKYCSNCGHPLEDDAHFCSNCGHRCGEKNLADVEKASVVDRKGMRISCWVSVIIGIISMVMAFTDDYSMMAMAAFCFPLAGMFYILSKTPKKSKYLFGASSGIRRSFFVTACIVLSFVLFMILSDEYGWPETEPEEEQEESYFEYDHTWMIPDTDIFL